MNPDKEITDLRVENERLKLEVEKLRLGTAAGDLKVEDGEARLKIAYEAAIQSLVRAIESKDPYTAGRYELVSKYAVTTGRALGLPAEDLDRLRAGGLLMDLGKVGIDNNLLVKVERLTPAEEEIIKSHVDIGAEILDPIVYPWDVSTLVYQHHERYDGSGYPEGLAGEEILLEARILGVCDSFVAMMASRAYRDAYSRDFTVRTLMGESGKLYDPRVVEAFIGVLENNKEAVMEDFEKSLPKREKDGVN